MLSSKDAEYKLAQSGDATCNGLDSAEVSIFQAPIQHGPGAPFLSLPVFTCHFHLTALRKKNCLPTVLWISGQSFSAKLWSWISDHNKFTSS